MCIIIIYHLSQYFTRSLIVLPDTKFYCTALLESLHQIITQIMQFNNLHSDDWLHTSPKFKS